MEITYDPKVDALNITFKKGNVCETLEIAPEIILDLDRKGRPLYLEIIGASEKIRTCLANARQNLDSLKHKHIILN